MAVQRLRQQSFSYYPSFYKTFQEMKYYIIAGEASGDLHGSNLIKQLHVLDPEANVRCWGGTMMKDAGATLVKDYKSLAFMGFVEVMLFVKKTFSPTSQTCWF